MRVGPPQCTGVVLEGVAGGAGRALEGIDAANVLALAEELADVSFHAIQGSRALGMSGDCAIAGSQRIARAGVQAQAAHGLAEKAVRGQHRVLEVAERRAAPGDQVIERRSGAVMIVGEPE